MKEFHDYTCSVMGGNLRTLCFVDDGK